jgi:UPF0755 protein
MSRRSFRIALAIVVVSLGVAAVTGVVLVKRALDYPQVRRAGTGKEIEVEIQPGMSFPRIADLLERRGVISRPRWFRLYAMQRGVTTRVRSGRYTLRDDMSPEQVLDALIAGVPDVTVSVTVPEGLNMLEIFQIYDQAGIADAAELEARARDPEFLSAHGIDGKTVEGYLFPDTYRFRAPTDPDEVLERMIDQYRIVWDRVRRTHHASLQRLQKRLEWTDSDVLVLASIVEKEAAAASERPRIAQVFINRLVSPRFSPHNLDTDPTIRYGCMVPVKKSDACRKWDRTDRLHRAQLDDGDNPYNTYQHEGLPPGPICSPGRAALEAAADPDGSGYFFFVARNDGTHVFSRTRREHERAVDKFQR